VGAEAQEVHPESVEAEREPSQSLDRVGVHQGPRVAGTDRGRDAREVLERPHLVVGEHHRDEHGVGTDSRGHRGGVDSPPSIAVDDGQLSAAGRSQVPGGGEHRLVLDGADHQVAAALCPPTLQDPAEGEVVGLRPARGEDHLPRRAAGGGGDPVAGVVHGGAGPPAVLVGRGGVAEQLPQPGQEGRAHLGVEGGGRGVVEVDGLRRLHVEPV
jgi:hypothetical protein